jgi:hypothetical protein
VKFRPLADGLTAAERAIGRRLFKDPPDLHALIRRYGGYHLIPPEGWAEYAAAMKQWQEDRLSGLQGSAGGPQTGDAERSGPAPAANETPPTDLLGAVQGQRRSHGQGEAKRRRTAR